MISFLKNIFIGLLMSFFGTSCQLEVEKTDIDGFVGVWLLSEIEKTNTKEEIFFTAPDKNDKNKITAKEDKTFSAYLDIIDKKNPKITGVWERTDESIISLKVNEKRENLSDVIMLYRQKEFYILVSDIYYVNDSIIKYKFEKK